MRKPIRSRTVLALALPALLGTGAFHIVAGNNDAAAAPTPMPGLSGTPIPRATPTPGTIDVTVPPAGAKVRLPKVDLRPVSITLARTDGSAYWVRVSYQCQSDLPVRLESVTVKVRPVASRYPERPGSFLGGPCGARQSTEIFCEGTEAYEAILDPASLIHETDEDNNVCRFSRASFGTGTQFVCP